MGSEENKKPVKRASTHSKQILNRRNKSTASPTKRTDVVRPKASTRQKPSVNRAKLSSGSNSGLKRRAASNSQARSGSHARSSSSYSSRAASHKPATKEERREVIVQRVTSSRIALVAIAIVCVIVVVGIFDNVSNWGKAYGNVSINGINVGGMTSEQIVDTLKSEYGNRVSHAQVTIYANEEAQRNGAQPVVEKELEETAEELAVEDVESQVQSWNVDALTLHGSIPYEKAAQEAIDFGRANGGIGKRFGLLVSPENVKVGVEFDKGKIEELASQIDSSIGDPRIDTTVVVMNGKADIAEGHAGTLVDRSWLAQKTSDAMMSGEETSSFVAEAVEAQSRISNEQAAEMAEKVNKAISKGVNFIYQGKDWLADAAMLSDWTVVNVVGDEGNWHLEPAIDTSRAIPAIVSNTHAEITSDDMDVTFEVSGSDVWVHTQGSGNIPEVQTAASQLQDLLYGESGALWGAGPSEPINIEITESDRPETLSFDDAVNMGVITAIGEYTTEFSNYEGTENRNHNIKLVSDIFNNGIVSAKGGKWSFNDRSGDTNEEAGFWTAGSIVNGEYVDSVGGGICQVATTVFNAVLESGLEVVERHNHTLYIASYPTGRDAAVDYPSDLDLEWKNGLDSDVLVKTSYTDTSVTVQLFSVRTGYKASFELGSWQPGANYSTVTEHDNTLGAGSYYRKQVGENGSSITLTREVTDEKGDPVRTDVFESVYKPKDEVIVVGDGVDTSNFA